MAWRFEARGAFAWTPTGSPKKGFLLEVANVLEAERKLVERLSRG